MESQRWDQVWLMAGIYIWRTVMIYILSLGKVDYDNFET